MDPDRFYRALKARDARFDGRFFIAVRTTGIYCRPICPARTPKLENITFYSSAAAAQEAGYRPCLRCRPESSPELAAWRGTSNTVSRAMMLIAEGALADADVESFAQRLGVGGRQLRRLFQKHLGTSPIAVAQTRRLLFAKKLVHETSMPMAEIAHAAGFRSLRRFNDTFHRLYGRPPSELRRHRAHAESAITLSLSYVPPYDWEEMRAFHAARAVPGVERVEGDTYSRTIELDGARGTIAVRPSKKNNALALTIDFPVVSALPTIVARVRRMFDLDADVRVIHGTLKQDPLLAKLVAKRPGLRVPGSWDPFEQTVRAILGQQITVTAARGLAAKVVARYSDGQTFPRPKDLLAVDLPMPRARNATIERCARAFVDDPACPLEHLRTLPGIGEWTMQYIALRAFRDPDAFPATDIGILKAAGRPTPKSLLERAESWRPWRAYAAQHLWCSVPVASKITELPVALPKKRSA